MTDEKEQKIRAIAKELGLAPEKVKKLLDEKETRYSTAELDGASANIFPNGESPVKQARNTVNAPPREIVTAQDILAGRQGKQIPERENARDILSNRTNGKPRRVSDR